MTLLKFSVPKSIWYAPFIDVEGDGDGAIPPIHGIVRFVDLLNDRRRSIVL